MSQIDYTIVKVNPTLLSNMTMQEKEIFFPDLPGSLLERKTKIAKIVNYENNILNIRNFDITTEESDILFKIYFKSSYTDKNIEDLYEFSLTLEDITNTESQTFIEAIHEKAWHQYAQDLFIYGKTKGVVKLLLNEMYTEDIFLVISKRYKLVSLSKKDKMEKELNKLISRRRTLIRAKLKEKILELNKEDFTSINAAADEAVSRALNEVFKNTFLLSTFKNNIKIQYDLAHRLLSNEYGKLSQEEFIVKIKEDVLNTFVVEIRVENASEHYKDVEIFNLVLARIKARKDDVEIWIKYTVDILCKILEKTLSKSRVFEEDEDLKFSTDLTAELNSDNAIKKWEDLISSMFVYDEFFNPICIKDAYKSQQHWDNQKCYNSLLRFKLVKDIAEQFKEKIAYLLTGESVDVLVIPTFDELVQKKIISKEDILAGRAASDPKSNSQKRVMAYIAGYVCRTLNDICLHDVPRANCQECSGKEQAKTSRSKKSRSKKYVISVDESMKVKIYDAITVPKSSKEVLDLDVYKFIGIKEEINLSYPSISFIDLCSAIHQINTEKLITYETMLATTYSTNSKTLTQKCVEFMLQSEIFKELTIEFDVHLPESMTTEQKKAFYEHVVTKMTNCYHNRKLKMLSMDINTFVGGVESDSFRTKLKKS